MVQASANRLRRMKAMPRPKGETCRSAGKAKGSLKPQQMDAKLSAYIMFLGMFGDGWGIGF